ncbi:MAG: hypothetical protein E7050_06915 [Lentisphaerae bacterium]|nr:hypothetical protein [Lentisphaerota bacterium]
MNKRHVAIDFAPDTVLHRHPLWLIWLAAAVILLILLGHDYFFPGEGDLAESIRRIAAGEDLFNNQWQPESPAAFWGSSFRSFWSGLLGINEFAIRFPSVISALLLLGGTMILAEDFFNHKVMCCTAWMLIGSCGFIYWGRYAGNYITLAAWVVWSAVLLRNARDYFWWRGMFFLLFFGGTAWWGVHYLLLMPGLLVMNMASCQRALFRARSFLAAGFALPVILGILAWMVSTPDIGVLEYPVRVWILLKGTFVESLQSAVYPNRNLYLGWFNLFCLLLPWTLPAVLAVIGMFWQWKELSADHRRLLLGSLFMLFFAGIFPGRSWQYQLPQLPFFLMLCGAGVSGETGVWLWQEKCNLVMKWVAMILCSLAAAVIVTWPLWELVFFAPPSKWLMFAVPFLGLLGLGMLVFDTGISSAVEQSSGMRGSWSGYILALVCFMTAFLAVGKPALAEYRTKSNFWKECGGVSGRYPVNETVFFGSHPGSLALYYMDLPGDPQSAPDAAALENVLASITSGDAKIIVRCCDVVPLKNGLEKLSWQLESTPLVLESGAGDFSADAPCGGGKFLLFRCWKISPSK